jgi:hypothetical protein
MVWVQTNFTAEAMNTGKPAKPAVVKEKPVAKKKDKVEPVVVAEVVETPVVEEVVVAEPEVVAPEAE